MKVNDLLTESKKELVLEKLPYGKKELGPIMSQDTIDYHYGKLAAGYVKRYNAGEGDAKFNEAGAFLHNIFFPQMMEPKSGNKPSGTSKELIDRKYGSFEKFKEEFTKVAMGIQGSGWVYMSKTGDIKTIVNHQVKNDIAMLVDWWEHAWALDYEHDKGKYLTNIWRIINWDTVNRKLT